MARTLAAGAVVQDAEGRVLLVRRARPPQRGYWSIPGGHVEEGETLREAVAREVAEETGLRVRVGDELGMVEVPGGGETFEVHDFAATLEDGELSAGDDASDAGWFGYTELLTMRLTDGLLDAFAEYGVVVAG